MRFIVAFLLMIGCGFGARARIPQQTPPGPQQAASSTSPGTDQVGAPPQTPALPGTLSSEGGTMEPAEVQALLHKVWVAEYRVNDLLSELHPENWRLPAEASAPFNQTLQTLRTEMAALEQWRAQFEKRADSAYLGFETYVAIGAVLPRLDGVARTMAAHENSSLTAQHSQAGNQLYDLQQALRPYLGFLLRNQDQLLLASQTNLAACQNQLGHAMRGAAGPAKPMKNAPPVRPERRRSSRGTTATGRTTAKEKSENKTIPKRRPPRKPGAAAPATSEQKQP